MSTVVDRLRTWQAAGGPDLWQRSWDRAISVVEGPLAGYEIRLDGVVIAEGAAGLATALYILSAEHGIDPDQVVDEQVRELYDGEMAGEERQALWERRLAALGHDLTDTCDPVVQVWTIITHTYTTPGAAWDDAFDASMTRWGRGYTDGMTRLRTRFGISL
ncbi:hypothetical protein HUT18_11515 [Streptomyces sp. NA04227]|uniref:hypothetical protein n=1 Tax=Streptomyces sp. NA04227 TaxID=2742136 RepID=UPI00158FFB0F|nr:hypothetical protein [Streptomyces sp. NA04227]QKW06927.1 hypothetical protein HUT18_11515 [Streptomyces sp. NA04227]